MGARGGFIAPDEVTFEYIKGREYTPKGEDWDKAVAYWKTLKSGEDAVFDKELTFNAADIEPRITYGTIRVWASALRKVYRQIETVLKPGGCHT